MKQYHELLQNILTNGVRQQNRTGIATLTLPGAMLKFDLRDGFPAVTTKKLAFKSVVGELIAFLRGHDNVYDFKDLGCNIWDLNAFSDSWLNNPAYNGEDGHLGRIYGKQWRNWRGFKSSNPNSVIAIDQIAVALDTLRNNPESRRIIVNAWNAAELEQAALPPCHVLFQLIPHVESKVLHMTMYQRSCDMFLGIPFNIASYALLLELFAAWAGYTAGTLTMFLADAHIYVNHLDQVKEQLNREPFPGPTLILPTNQFDTSLHLEELLRRLDPDRIRLLDYQSHPTIKAQMAV